MIEDDRDRGRRERAVARVVDRDDGVGVAPVGRDRRVDEARRERRADQRRAPVDVVAGDPRRVARGIPRERRPHDRRGPGGGADLVRRRGIDRRRGRQRRGARVAGGIGRDDRVAVRALRKHARVEEARCRRRRDGRAARRRGRPSTPRLQRHRCRRMPSSSRAGGWWGSAQATLVGISGAVLSKMLRWMDVVALALPAASTLRTV